MDPLAGLDQLGPADPEAVGAGVAATVTNDEGSLFNLRLVRHGDRYGLNDCLVHEPKPGLSGDGPLIEFYGAESADAEEPRGYFISSYYVSTLLGEDPPYDPSDRELREYGLDLDGGSPSAEIDGPAMNQVLTWLTRVVYGFNKRPPIRAMDPEVTASSLAVPQRADNGRRSEDCPATTRSCSP